MINYSDIKVGDKVFLPVYPLREPLPGTVIYVHPEKRFFRAEFVTETGELVRESFSLYGPVLP